MSIRFKELFWVLGVWIMIQSCDPCDDCGQSLEYSPSIDLIFINQSDFLLVEDSIDQTNILLDSIDSVQSVILSTIEYWNDLIGKTQAEIDSGDVSLEDSLLELTNLVDLFGDTLRLNLLKIDTLDSINSLMAGIKTDLSSGLIKPLKITIINNAQEFDYEDSAKIFTLPLILSESMTRYEINFEREIFMLDVTYETAEVINEQRQVTVIASNIIPTTDTFDSLTFECNNRLECLNNETDVTLYF
ncbi:MAG: hypothetical protein ACI9A7_002144 [Cyclobacteriaceae bacterium]|jgi:hypothetical protein